ncbi:MAG: hypothetical protein GWN84_14145 [Gammaproteobacteria bacterium]|nr:hypothetical protein [Gammaproteobacteria bacterium]NIR83940.1 hypothetical protein [Gammaproteobacteria bacterium]NIR88983.1 hypothetical protein [Gammaproteobacteria bacterium]NIV74536.1 hypothetical protein [Gammaproteobacteria bacterium]
MKTLDVTHRSAVRSTVRRLRWIPFLVLSGVLVACGEYVPRWTLPEGPPAFREGARDACLTAMEDAKNWTLPQQFGTPQNFKDEKRFESDSEYRDGWKATYDYCYQRELDYQSLRGQGEGTQR